MTTAPTSEHRQGSSVPRTPAAVRTALVAVGALVLGSAVYLWAERGPALLLDLAHIGARFLCL